MAEASLATLPTGEETVRQAFLENLNSYTFLHPLSESEPERSSESDSDDEDYHSLLSENLEADSHVFLDTLFDSGPMDSDDERFKSEPDSDLEEWFPEEFTIRLGSDLNPDPDWADTEDLPEFLQMDIDGLQFSGLESYSDSDDRFLVPDSIANSPDELTEELYDCVQFDEQIEIPIVNQDQEWEAISTDTNSQSDLEEMVRNLEWEVLLAVNSMYGDAEPFFDGERPSEVTFFRQILESDGSVKGGPPASKLAVRNLPSVCIEKIDCELECAVCKDAFLIGETVKRLPCLHDYHANCIVPWLGMRNTCPLCRYELATDDLEYDNWRANQGNHV